MKDADCNPTKEFVISAKTTYLQLAGEKSIRDSRLRWRIAGDVINNARELERGINWVEVLSHIFWVQDKDIFYGRKAIANSIAVSLASIAINMGWSMHSPEVVYMSGLHPLRGLVKHIESLDENIAKAPERKFESEEKKEEIIRKERDEAGRLSIFRKRLEESLGEYAKQNLPENPTYLRILRRILYVKPEIRRKIIFFLRNGQIESAATLL